MKKIHLNLLTGPRSFFLILFPLVFFYSCVSHKKSVYLQSENSAAKDSVPHYIYKYKIQPKDRLGINVSSFNKQVTDFYNRESNNTHEEVPGFQVNEAGYIHLPMMDSILVKGKTIIEVQDQLQKTMREQVSDALVIVSLVNFKITVLGEIRSPGIFTSLDDELTLFEALALAGDITEHGNREQIKIVREKGKTFEVVTINANRRDILSNPDFYIQPNDVIYVEPLKVKVLRTNLSQLSIILGFTTLILFILNYLRS